MQTTQQDRRDQFAMAALKGTLSSPEYPNWDDYETIAKDSFNIADAMILASATPAPSGKLEEDEDDRLSSVENDLINLANEVGGLRMYQIKGRIDSILNSILLATTNEASESALPDKSEVKELPARCCIERTPENAEMVNGWLNETKGRIAHSYSNYFVHHPAFADDGKCVKQEPLPGYTLIDDATFKAQVLKQQPAKVPEYLAVLITDENQHEIRKHFATPQENHFPVGSWFHYPAHSECRCWLHVAEGYTIAPLSEIIPF